MAYNSAYKGSQVDAVVGAVLAKEKTWDDSVIIPGGAISTVPDILGEGPYIFEYTEEEDDLTADRIFYDNAVTGMEAKSVQAAVDMLFTSASNGKAKIAAAITGKGVNTESNDSFDTMAANIEMIEGGTDTSDADLRGAHCPWTRVETGV